MNLPDLFLLSMGKQALHFLTDHTLRGKKIIITWHFLTFLFYFIFIMGDVFCFGNMDFVLTCWKLLFFQEKNSREADFFLSDVFADFFICQNDFFFVVKIKPNFPKKTLLWECLLIPTCFCCCWMLLKMYHSSSFQPTIVPISIHLPEHVYIGCTCTYMYAQD